ncbi:relaxase/mobilization nuclease domain-containing protein [Streptomyces sedi]|uniref:Mobilization protein n=1 Tax=Streptomyces sedi TaxID=555059 RepID=A0A5C4ULS5_9ACTN|nr:relaxase/mobilization nuclease domain-containing protein [Streptomyces sedi]TNM24584.1 mobilization protein [Streptomyces sedi]
MIPKISTGSRTIGLLAYLYGPGLREEHTDPHLVGGWDPAPPDPGRDPDATLADLARLLDQPVAAAGPRRPTSHVWHCSIRAAPEDRPLSDTEWKAIAERVLAAVGIADPDDPAGCRWVAVRHAPDHIHVVATLVREDGRRPQRSFERRKAQAACRAVEKEYGLRQLNPGDGTAAAGAPRAEHHKAIRMGRETAPRDQLRTLVRQSLAGATDIPEFLDRLDEHGVLIRLRRAPSGDITGFTLALPDHVTATGEPVWYSGGKLAPDLSWPQISRRLTPAAREETDDADLLPSPATARRTTADTARHTATELTDADDDQAADLLTGTGEVLDALATTATGPTRRDITAAATAFERASRFHHRAAHAHHQALRRAARQLLASGPTLGRGQDGAASAMLISALILLVTTAHRWHAARGHQQQAAAALATAHHLRAAYGITAAPHLAALHQRGLRLAPAVHGQLANTVHSAAPDLAEQILTDPRWPVLAAALADLHTTHPHADITSTLREAIHSRELDTADSLIDVLIWRLHHLTPEPPTTPSPANPRTPGRPRETDPPGRTR